MFLKIFNYIFFVLFLLSAILQYNDPDPFLWIVIYGVASIICFQAARSRFNKYLLIIALSGYALGIIILYPGVVEWGQLGFEDLAQSMQAEKKYVEETREFFGLLILFVIVSINGLAYRKKQQLSI